MNVNYHCDELISKIVMKFEEVKKQKHIYPRDQLRLMVWVLNMSQTW
jgi:hypothetical protein